MSTKALIWEKSDLPLGKSSFPLNIRSNLNLDYGLGYIQKYFGILPHLLLTLPHIWNNLSFLLTSPPLCAFDRFMPIAENSENIYSFTNLRITAPSVTGMLCHWQWALTLDSHRNFMRLLCLPSLHAGEETDSGWVWQVRRWLALGPGGSGRAEVGTQSSNNPDSSSP